MFGHNQSYDAAKFDIIWKSDAGLRVYPDTLADMITYLEEDVGLVAQVPFVSERSGLTSFIDKVTLIATTYFIIYKSLLG